VPQLEIKGPGASQIMGPSISNFCLTKFHNTKNAIKGGAYNPLVTKDP